MNLKKKSNLLIILLLIILTNLGTYYFMKNKSDEISSEQQLETLHKLDSLNNVIAKQENDYKMLGIENKELSSLKEELELSISELKSGAYKKNKSYNILQEKVEAYETMLLERDKEIEKLKKTADALVEYNKELKETIHDKNASIQGLEQEKIELMGKVKEASVLDAENFTVVYATSKGKVKDKQPFKAKDIDVIKIEWFLKSNVVAEAGTRNVYIIIKEPSGTAIYNESLGAGSFQMDEKIYYYTKRTSVNYDPSKDNEASIIYRNPIDFKSGTHTVEAYCDGHMIGKTAFLIK